MVEDFSDWIGRSVIRRDVVTRRLLAEFGAILGPRAFPAANGTAPPGFHFGLAPAILPRTELGDDGAEDRGTFMPPLPFARRMWAGGRLETLAPLREGEKITRRSTLLDVARRDGRSGAFYVVTVLHEIEADATLRVREEQQLVYRQSIRPASPPPAPPLAAGLTWDLSLDALDLFRYSAFTFNGHRIHYDLDFARGAEAHDGLLVHGPLQATLLLNQMAHLAGGVPPQFSYRCLSPLTAGSMFRVESRAAAEGLAGRIVSAAGAVTCEAHAPGTAAA